MVTGFLIENSFLIPAILAFLLSQPSLEARERRPLADSFKPRATRMKRDKVKMVSAIAGFILESNIHHTVIIVNRVIYPRRENLAQGPGLNLWLNLDVLDVCNRCVVNTHWMCISV